MKIDRTIRSKTGGPVLAFLLALALVLSLATPVFAVVFPPPTPHLFYGAVTIGGNPAPEGIGVSAWVHEAKVASTTVDAHGNYQFSVQASPGDTIRFFVHDVWAVDYPWAAGAVTELALDIVVEPPTVTITIDDPITIANVEAVPVTITSDQDGTYAFTIGDGIISITGYSDILVDVPVELTLDLSTLADGLITAGATVESVFRIIGVAPGDTATKDTAAPTVVITSPALDPTDVSPILIVVTFTEAVIGFMADNITLTNADLVPDTFTTADNITWTFDVTPVVDGLVTVDIAAGAATDNATNPNEAAPTFSITFTAMVTFYLHLTAGWNLISLPVHPIVTCPAELLPDAIAVFAWDPVNKFYYTPLELVARKGYWVLVLEDVTHPIKGTRVEDYKFVGDAGWHMIGSLWVDGEVYVITGEVSPFLFAWDPVNKSYILTEILKPGKGYWFLALNAFEVWVRPVPPAPPAGS